MQVKGFLTLALNMLLFVAIGQSRYISISGGYGLGIPGNEGVEVVEYLDGKTTETLKYLNFGGGLNIDIAYGAPIGKTLHFELSAGYQSNMGVTTKNSYFREEFNNAGHYILVEDVSIRNIYASSFRFAPGFRFIAGEGDLRGFAKVAPQIVVAQVRGEYEFTSSTVEFRSKDEYSREVSVGFLGALGVEFDISERIVGFTCINASLGYYSPDSWELVEYEYVGSNSSNGSPYPYHEIYFEEEIEVSDTSGTRKMLKSRMDYSSIALNIGIRILL